MCHGQQGTAKQSREAQAKERETQTRTPHLIVFKCDPRVLRLRLANRDKAYTEQQLIPQAEAIENTWCGQPATVIDTTNMSISQVVAKVLETILFNPYEPIDFHQLCSLKAGAAA